MDDRASRSIVSQRPNIDPDAEMERLEQEGTLAINWHDPSYPPRLKEIHDPPPVLYLKGQLLPEDERAVAVVGTRKATAYGREAAHSLAYDLARNGVTVVSGLARGIDAIAHRAALEAGGRTIAVFGSGPDVIYPPEHTRLAQEIQETGALATEHALGARPDARNFPRRNRLLSGMTLGTLVVEAGEKSGALLTVRHALEQDREVFCIPGSIFSPSSQGTNALIQEGAKLVLDYKDVLEELNLTVVSHQIEMREILQPQDDTEALLLGHVTHQPVHIDELRRSAQLPISAVSSALAVMDLKGLIKRVGVMHYIRVREAVVPYGN
jgi:DNA processing protein